MEDQESTTEVAYVSGTSPFTLADQPFPFWTDPSWEPYDEWVEFTFPLLAVGSSTLYTSYSGTGINDLYVLCQDCLDPGGWLNFGAWLLRHYQDATEMNDILAGDFDLMCQMCATTDELIRQAIEDFLKNARGYSQADLDNFCASVYTVGYCDELTAASDKAKEVRRACNSKFEEDVLGLIDTVEDYVNHNYWEDLNIFDYLNAV